MGTNMQFSYETDFAAWAAPQAMLLQLGKWEALDQEHLVEELEGLSRSEQNELEHRLELLTMHLLKWRHRIALQHGEPHRHPAGRGRHLHLASAPTMPLMRRHEGDVVHADVVVMLLDP